MSIFDNGSKLLRWPERIVSYRRGELFPPVMAALDLTNRCNLKCPHCQDSGIDRSVELSTDTAMDWLQQLRDYGVESVQFGGGGEPLIHPDALPVIHCAHCLGLSVSLVTNGTALVHQMEEPLLSDCDWIRVSIDAGDEVMYRQVHGSDDFERAWRTVSRFGFANADKVCVLGVGYLVNAATKSGMLSAVLRASGGRADYIQFRPYHNDFTPIDDVLPFLRQHETDKFKVLCSEQKYARFGPPPWRDYDYCHSAHFTTVIQASGDVTVCCHGRTLPNMVFGNMHEQSFAEIWASDCRREVLDAIDVSKCVPFCKGDTSNRLLDKVMCPQQHEAFV